MVAGDTVRDRGEARASSSVVAGVGAAPVARRARVEPSETSTPGAGGHLKRAPGRPPPVAGPIEHGCQRRAMEVVKGSIGSIGSIAAGPSRPRFSRLRAGGSRGGRGNFCRPFWAYGGPAAIDPIDPIDPPESQSPRFYGASAARGEGRSRVDRVDERVGGVFIDPLIDPPSGVRMPLAAARSADRSATRHGPDPSRRCLALERRACAPRDGQRGGSSRDLDRGRSRPSEGRLVCRVRRVLLLVPRSPLQV